MDDGGQPSDSTLTDLRTIRDQLGILIQMQTLAAALLVAVAAILVCSDPSLRFIAGVTGFSLAMILFPSTRKPGRDDTRAADVSV